MKWQYLIKNKFPNIYSEKSFFYFTKIRKKTYYQILNDIENQYKKSLKTKKDGISKREIYKPTQELKILLKRINKHVLSKINFPPFVHCGPKQRSIKTALLGHHKYTNHQTLDIENFFDSVSGQTTTQSLRHIGLSKKLIILLCKICVQDNKLPQGFPTSSLLSTVVICATLEDFYKHFDRKNIILSIYADDILLSSDNGELISSAKCFIKNRLSIIHLSLNAKDTFAKSGQKFTWCGLQIYPWISVPRKKINLIQKDIHDFKSKGTLPDKFKPYKRKTGVKKWKKSVKGKINFIKHINTTNRILKIEKSLNLPPMKSTQ